MEFVITRSTNPKSAQEREAILENPGFGRSFTDHMVTIEYDAEKGWHSAKVLPYSEIKIDPANMALHYGQQIFEGLKAYRHQDGSIKAFRPFNNAARFNRSAKRLAMPELDEAVFVQAIKELVSIDSAWVPSDKEKSLYLRPFMFATEVGLGVRPANKYLFMLIASPAGAYFPKGLKPVSVWLSEEYVRAAVGGTGEAKCAGNYAASLIAQAQASEQGCDQVVWIDATERKWIEEMGGMNLYFVFRTANGPKLITPKLTGSLLPGITRDSILTLAKDLGFEVEEGKISIDDWREGAASGQIQEVFACGTAAVITPVGQVMSTRANWTINQNQTGEITSKLRENLLAIQTGDAPDNHDWIFELVPKNK